MADAEISAEELDYEHEPSGEEAASRAEGDQVCRASLENKFPGPRSQYPSGFKVKLSKSMTLWIYLNFVSTTEYYTLRGIEKY